MSSEICFNLDWSKILSSCDENLDCSNLKTFADDKLKVGQMTNFLFIRTENKFPKGENAVT